MTSIESQLRSLGIDPARCTIGPPIGKTLADTCSRSREVLASGQHVIRFSVPGSPIGKPRMTLRDKWHKRPCTARYWAWKDSARAAAGELPGAKQVVAVVVRAYFMPPPSWLKPKRVKSIGEPHRQRPDADNVLKSVLDALWPDDDSGVADATVTKRWDWNARVEIEITSFGS